MVDLKALKAGLEQMEEERHIPREKILATIEDSLVAAYKKDYGKKGQIIRTKFDLGTGKTDFYQVKIVADETTTRLEEEEEKIDEDDERPKFNIEHHITLEDARKIKKNSEVGDEIIFPLETKDDYGRIAAQTAKQVIIQRLREAEKESTLGEYKDQVGLILNGTVQKVDRGTVFVELGRAIGVILRDDQIPGEFYRQGERIRAYLYQVEETPRGINLRLSRSHPEFVKKLFAAEAPEVASGVVEIKAVAREAGSRSKIAVWSNSPNIDPVGSCVGQKGSRVSAVIGELGGEKIDIVEWSEKPEEFITNALSPAKVTSLILNDEDKEAQIEVEPDQFSLAVGKGGQNARLAAKLTGWKVDISSPELEDEEEKTNEEPTKEIAQELSTNNNEE